MGKTRVLFVCLGNAIRSQMAEAFARAYGSDVVEAASAGLTPATVIAPLTRKVMRERKNLDLAGQYPKGLDELDLAAFDLVINLSGVRLLLPVPCRDWRVRDPVGEGEEVYAGAAEEIERRVMGLILDLRRGPTGI